MNYHAHKLLTTILSLTNYCQEVFGPRLKFPGWAMPTLIFSRVGACPPCSPRAGAHACCHTMCGSVTARQVHVFRRGLQWNINRQRKSCRRCSVCDAFWIELISFAWRNFSSVFWLVAIGGDIVTTEVETYGVSSNGGWRCSKSRGRGATGSRGSIDSPLFQVRGPCI